ncbi:septal ring lytic transglycosylase RlpA family protein [Scytonema hofmannii FACHB-248]|uniref:Probable endolytic peptidoglycan transglycosylase RlpA n=1 Tax=Scytonema hofmannii FACHB-248 TaxID=1842502 RepID=A0ABR8GP19_9CYAN|nr:MULTISPECIES: septal ring lytic transglycosylase RlpA family protein [Nostocales]MBD2605171.1 septal ring lytic transglycosylase RlpA family protein [Scytonema hofmannii FACHB-248]
MKQTQLWSVVALSTTVLGLPSVSRAATTNGNSTTPDETTGNDGVNVKKPQSIREKLISRDMVTQIHSHNLAGRQATTLYIRNIPFLTFVSEADISNSDERAIALATKINQLITDKVDASQITVSWKADSYIIKVNGEELVKIDGKTTRLPDTTNNLSQDAMQATNRLRRLIDVAHALNQNQITSIALPPQEPIKQPQQPATKPQEVKKQPQQNATGKVQATSKGMASYYSYEGGNRTATGERFNPQGLTAAHRSLPFGTRVRVTNTGNGRSVVVRINDRGPFIRGRVIDLSLSAARELGMISSGVAAVKLEILSN